MGVSGHGFDRSIDGEQDGDKPKKATLISGGGKPVMGCECEDPVALAIRNLIAPHYQCRKCGAGLRRGNVMGICSPCARSPARKRMSASLIRRLESLHQHLGASAKMLVEGGTVQ